MRSTLPAAVLAFLSFVCFSHRTTADEEPTPHAVIDRALKAGGGAEKIGQFKAVSFKADFSDGMEKGGISGLIAGPKLFRLERDSKDSGRTVHVGNGDSVWVLAGNRVEEQAHTFDTDVFVYYGISLPHRLLSLKSKECKVKVVGEEAVNGVQAINVRINDKNFEKSLCHFDLYFDKATGLPIKVKGSAVAELPKEGDPAGQFLTLTLFEAYFDDYKEFDGVRHFTKLRLHMGETTIEYQIRELQLHKSFDAKEFKKPG